MKNRKTIVAAAVASILVASGSSALAEYGSSKTKTAPTTSTNGYCKVANSCAGKNDGGTDKHNCAGKASCKGHGWVYHKVDNKKASVTKDECDKLGGKFAQKTTH